MEFYIYAYVAVLHGHSGYLGPRPNIPDLTFPIDFHGVDTGHRACPTSHTLPTSFSITPSPTFSFEKKMLQTEGKFPLSDIISIYEVITVSTDQMSRLLIFR